MAQRGRGGLVWDGPTRLFHWLLVGLLGFSWWSAETDHMEWHLTSGLAVCALILFRLIWGVIGPSTARFADFVHGPRAIWAYLRRHPAAIPAASLGHNPIGAVSVLAMLAVVGVQVLSGLFAVDVDGIESGPLSIHVDFDQGRSAAAIHAAGFNIILALVALHVAAILFYLVVRRRNLIRAMITGRAAEGGIGISTVPWWRFAGAVAIAALASWWISRGGW